ncbi:MAG: hypothetical protein JWN24_383 [Phycisphaerales bacterium]|nr:hypothetical protein [Phycisphaerales bacterium]
MDHVVVRHHGLIAFTILLLSCSDSRAQATQPADVRSQEQRLSFQTSGPWSPRVQLNADVAMCYGIDKTLPDRMKSWRDHGYTVQLMTGVAWGSYQDYLYGRWDGKNHEDEAQTDKSGAKVGHGGDVYYMSPGPSYGEYLASGVRKALDAGAEAVYLEEPEFWVRSGWSEGFKREWKEYYHEDWVAPDSSPEAQYRASKLKYFLYRRALAQVFASVKQWGHEHGKSIPCYVPTHSLINYAHWQIVSPESSLLQVGCDGYIAQVWTGTSRTPNVYQNVMKERTFETAFLEYGAMQNLVRASGRRVWYLNDPIEDDPNHTWSDYRTNWQNTLTASLLQPEVWRYEIMPWPQRIFLRNYPATMPANRRRGRVPIPAAYETELQSVISALGDMKQPPEAVRWERSGTQGVGVLVSDTMMFQRGGPGASDENLGSFYGLSMPLVKAGLPIEPVQIETSTQTGFLDRYKILLLTYEGQKPPAPEFHQALAAWVRAGGALVVVDDDKDAYHAVREWWNTAPMNYATPRLHLFEQLGLAADAKFPAKVGNGCVLYDAVSPATLTYRNDGGRHVTSLVHAAADRIGLKWTVSNALVLRRGPYVVAAGLDESLADAKPCTIRGRLVPLFDENLPMVDSYEIKEGDRQLLLDLSALPKDKVGVVAAACRVRGETVNQESIKFRAEGLEGSRAVVRIAMPRSPKAVTVGGAAPNSDTYDYAGGTLRMRFTNSAAGVEVEIVR